MWGEVEGLEYIRERYLDVQLMNDKDILDPSISVLDT